MNPVKFGIIGTGGRGGEGFGQRIGKREDVLIQALCDPNPVRMKAAAERFANHPACYATVEELLTAERLDAVLITSPDYCHEDNAVAALKRGVHVLVDKPLATAVQGCRNIIQAAEEAGKTVMIGFNMRHHPAIRRLKQIVDEGTLGRVFLIECRSFYNFGRTYMSRWNRKREYSGGLWVHKGSHDFDVLQWLLGFPRPVKVSATAGINVFTPEHIPFEVAPGTQVGPTCHECAYLETCPDGVPFTDVAWSDEARAVDGYDKDLCIYTSDKDVHDNGNAIVEYDNGARASYLECFVTADGDRLFTVVGDRGLAEVSVHRDRTIVVRPRWNKETIRYDIPEEPGGHEGADPLLIEEFLDVIRGRKANVSTAEEGMWATAVGQAAEISRRENRTVLMNELMD